MITHKQANPATWPSEALALVRLSWRSGGRLERVEEMLVFRGEGGAELFGVTLHQAKQRQDLDVHVFSGYTAEQLGLHPVC